MPGYVAHLIGGGPIRHKDDAHLKIGPVTFTSPDDQRTVSGHAVERDNMTLANYAASLAAAIAAKGAKAKGYRSGLSHVNLVIVDHATPFVLAAPDAANTIIFADAVWSAVIGAPFNEIYLVTEISPEPQGGAQQVYLPLRQLLLVSAAMLFPGALRTYAPGQRLRTPARRLHALCDYFVHQGLPAILRGTTSRPEVLVGTIGIRVAADGNFAIHDYLDAPTSPPLHRQSRLTPWRDAKFQVAFDAYRSRNWIRFTHVFPVRGATTATT